MRILDRYINNSILTIFISSTLIFMFLYVLIDVTSSLDEIIDRKISIEILIRYYLHFTPIIFTQTAPISCLISVLFTFSNLNNTNQIIAMRAAGLTFWKIAKPALFFGLIVTALVFFVNEKFVPQAAEITKKIENENMILYVDRLHKKREKINNLTFYGLKNRLYFVDRYNPQEQELRGITILEYNNNLNIQQKIIAFRGQWTGIAWKFYQTHITSYRDGNVNRPEKVRVYEEKLMDIRETPNDFLKQRLNVDMMNIRDLSDYIHRFSDSGAERALNRLRVDLHQKYSYPFGNFVIVLVGLPFALMVRNRKGMTFTAIGIAILIGFLYYVVNAVSIALGKGGLFPPLIAAWGAPILFTGIGLFTIENKLS